LITTVTENRLRGKGIIRGGKIGEDCGKIVGFIKFGIRFESSVQ